MADKRILIQKKQRFYLYRLDLRLRSFSDPPPPHPTLFVSVCFLLLPRGSLCRNESEKESLSGSLVREGDEGERTIVYSRILREAS